MKYENKTIRYKYFNTPHTQQKKDTLNIGIYNPIDKETENTNLLHCSYIKDITENLSCFGCGRDIYKRDQS